MRPIPVIASPTVSPCLQRTATPGLPNDTGALLCNTFFVPLVKGKGMSAMCIPRAYSTGFSALHSISSLECPFL